MTTQDDFAVTLPIAEALERLGVPYYVGGSVASSMHGIGHSTMDVDLIARLEQHHVSALMRMLERDYYIDEEMVRTAIGNKSSFNVIHFDLAYLHQWAAQLNVAQSLEKALSEAGIQ